MLHKAEHNLHKVKLNARVTVQSSTRCGRLLGGVHAQGHYHVFFLSCFAAFHAFILFLPLTPPVLASIHSTNWFVSVILENAWR